MAKVTQKTNFYTFLIKAENLLRDRLDKYRCDILDRPELFDLICAQSADAVEAMLHDSGLDFVRIACKTTKIKRRDTQINLIALKDGKPMRLNDLLYAKVPDKTFNKLEDWFDEFKPSMSSTGGSSDGSN